MASRRERLRRQRRGHASAGVIALRLAVVSVVVLVLLVVASGATALAVVDVWLKDLPDIDNPAAFAVALPTRIYSADGKLLANLYLENRQVIPLAQNAPNLREAVVAVEDERFYRHKGWDPEGVLRAAFIDLFRGRTAQGASTITQQYVRNTVLASEKNVKSVQRKVREMYVASEVEKKFSKDQILNMYMNTVYFGEGAYGTEAASLIYFGKHASQLNLGEAAMIAGLAQSPSRYSPYDNLKAARSRQAEVLTAMVRNGYATRAEADKAARAPLKLHRTTPTTGIYQAPYFVSYVQKALLRAVQHGGHLQGRPTGLHHPGHEAPGRGRACGAQRPWPARRSRRRARRDRPDHGRHQGDGRRPRFREAQVQLRHAGQAAAGILVQGVRTDRRDREAHPSLPRHRLGLSRRHPGGAGPAGSCRTRKARATVSSPSRPRPGTR